MNDIQYVGFIIIALMLGFTIGSYFTYKIMVKDLQ